MFLEGIPAEVVNLLHLLVGNVKPRDVLFEPFPLQRIAFAEHGPFIAGELDKIVVIVLRVEYRMRRLRAKLAGRKDLEQRQQHKDDRHAAQEDSDRRSGSRHSARNPSTLPWLTSNMWP